MDQIQKQVIQAFSGLQQQAMAAGQDLVKTIQGDFDLAPVQKIIKSGASVDEVHALITNKTVLKYAFWLVVANAVTVIAARQSVRGRNPVYTILASLACVFFAPTLFPLLTGNPITWIQNDSTVVSALAVAVASYLVLRHFLALLPFRIITAFVLSAASAGVVAAGWKVGLSAFKSTSGAYVVAALDSAARPFAVALEAYLVDGTLGPVKNIRSQLFGAAVYGAVLINTQNEKLALVATFAVIALGFISGQFGVPINWFYPIELVLLGTSSPKAKQAAVVVKAEPKHEAAAATTASPAKKGGKQ